MQSIVVDFWIAIRLAIAKDRPDRPQHQRFVVATELTVLGARGGMGTLVENVRQMSATPADSRRLAFTRTFVVARTDVGSSRQPLRAVEDGEIGTEFGQNIGSGVGVNAGHGLKQLKLPLPRRYRVAKVSRNASMCLAGHQAR